MFKYFFIVTCGYVLLTVFNNCAPEKFKSNTDFSVSSLAINNSLLIKNIESQITNLYPPQMRTQDFSGVIDLPNCTAKNNAEWSDCKNRLFSKSIDEIIIDGEIKCADVSCGLNVSDLQLFSLTGTENGRFTRTGGFSSALLNFSNIGQLKVQGIRVYESANQPTQLSPGEEEHNAICASSSKDLHSQCASTIQILYSQNVEILDSYFENGKVFNLMIYGNYSVNVARTILKNAFLFGAWGRFNKYVTIQSNVFEKNRSNGFLIDFGASDDGKFSASEDVKISDNYFSRNHYATAFHVCGSSGKDPCSGGQIDILGHIKKMTITGNKFINSGLLGEFPEDRREGIYITCIEFEGSNKVLSHVVIDNNYFANGDSGFFHVNTPQNPSANHLQFSNNKYCNMPRAYFNFNSDSEVMSNTQEICIPEWNEVPSVEQLPNPQLIEQSYTWSTSAWSSCSASPVYSYGEWGNCSTAGAQSRSSACVNQQGLETRSIFCKNSAGADVDFSFCDNSTKPKENQSCSKPCVGNPLVNRSCQPAPPPAPVSLVAQNCEIPIGFQVCSSTVTWNAPDYPSVCVFVDGSLFGCEGSQGSKIMPWISVGGNKVELRETSQSSSRVLASVLVKGVLATPVPVPVDTYSWESSNWGSCNAEPIFEYGAWSECSSQNKQTRLYQCINQSGYQSRTLSCKNNLGQLVADLNCIGLIKPVSSQVCTKSCDVQQAVTSQSCSNASSTVTPSLYVQGVALSSSHCMIDPGKDVCSSTVTWNAPDYPSVCVFVDGSLFGCEGSQGSKIMPWISVGGNKVELRETSQSSSRVLASLLVKGLLPKPTPSLTVTPSLYVQGVALSSSHCMIDPGKDVCSSTVTWNAPDYPSVCVFVDGSLFGCEGSQGSKIMPWISVGGNKVELRETSQSSSRVLASILVKGLTN